MLTLILRQGVYPTYRMLSAKLRRGWKGSSHVLLAYLTHNGSCWGGQQYRILEAIVPLIHDCAGDGSGGSRTIGRRWTVIPSPSLQLCWWVLCPPNWLTLDLGVPQGFFIPSSFRLQRNIPMKRRHLCSDAGLKPRSRSLVSGCKLSSRHTLNVTLRSGWMPDLMNGLPHQSYSARVTFILVDGAFAIYRCFTVIPGVLVMFLSWGSNRWRVRYWGHFRQLFTYIRTKKRSQFPSTHCVVNSLLGALMKRCLYRVDAVKSIHANRASYKKLFANRALWI